MEIIMFWFFVVFRCGIEDIIIWVNNMVKKMVLVFMEIW